METNRYVLEVLETIKQFQDTFQKFLTFLSNKVSPRKNNDGTIPLMFYFKDGRLFEDSAKEEKELTSFTTHFFRIEKIDYSTQCAIVTLLKPVDLESNPITTLTELYRLERTFCFKEVNLEKISAVQCLSPRLINRALPIIEPVWEE